MEEEKICFVIMPISDAEGYEKGHFTRVYEHLIRPAIEQAGFKPDRADDTSKANYIVVDILQKILACDIAICDLSSRNPNVFYELGIRQAFNKKTVLIKDSKTAMPFDISGIRTQPYSENLRVDEVKKDIPNLAKCISETYKADIKELNPLLQLLSIDKPADMPDKVKLSQDTHILLKEIKNIHNRIDILGANVTSSYINLPNGESVQIGTLLYIENKSIGLLIGQSEFHIMIKDANNRISYIAKDSDEASKLSLYPEVLRPI